MAGFKNEVANRKVIINDFGFDTSKHLPKVLINFRAEDAVIAILMARLLGSEMIWKLSFDTCERDEAHGVGFYKKTYVWWYDTHALVGHKGHLRGEPWAASEAEAFGVETRIGMKHSM